MTATSSRWLVELVGPVAEHLVELLHARPAPSPGARPRCRRSRPRPRAACRPRPPRGRACSPPRRVRLRDHGAHAAHGVGPAPVADGDELLRVGPHERDGHRHRVAVGQHELGPLAEALDHREQVVPAAGVQPGGVVAQLVEDLLHLERGRDRLDQDGGPDRAAVQRRVPPRRSRRPGSTGALRGATPAWARRSMAPSRGRAAPRRCGRTYSAKSMNAPATALQVRSGRCSPRTRASSGAGSSVSL